MSTSALCFEQRQRRQILFAILWITLIGSLIFGIYDLSTGALRSGAALLGQAGACVPLLVLTARKRVTAAATCLSVLVLTVITLNVFDGYGSHDAGVMAYPIFIALAPLLFGRRAVPVFTLAAGASIAGIISLEALGLLAPPPVTTDFAMLIPVTTMLLLAAAVTWVVVQTTGENLRRTRASEAELERNYELTIEAWARVLEVRHRETEGHSRRVVDWSTRLAEAIGCKREQIGDLRRGALLHDIGKLAVPDCVLLKPGELDEAERRLIERHPVHAREMLAGISFLAPAVAVAYSHHERWDGSGYPEGLRGEQIPLLARVFAVVDAWDALGADRPYRKAWPRERIVGYLRDNAGKLFDPAIVGVFFELVTAPGDRAAARAP